MNPIYNYVNLTEKQKRWLAVRSREAKKIDPATAKICWMWTPTLDPYCLVKEPQLESEIQRTYFAHRANCKILVWFGDLRSPRLRTRAVTCDKRHTGAGVVQFHRAQWSELPTMYHVVNALAALTMLEPRGGSVIESHGGKPYLDQRILK